MAPVPDHWTTLVHAIRGGTVRDFHFSQVDFSALDDDAFLVAICLHGLQSIALWTCVVPSGFVTDDLLRSGIAKGLVDLRFVVTKIDRLSEDAILDFCFPGDAVPGGRSQCLVLEGSGVTDMFVKNFFEVSTCCLSFPVLSSFRLTSNRLAHHLNSRPPYWNPEIRRYGETARLVGVRSVLGAAGRMVG